MAVGEKARAVPQAPAGRPSTIALVSVIVPHLDDYDNLDACLTLLAEQSFPSDRTEIIVADNGSSRGLDAVQRIVGTRGRVIQSPIAARDPPATPGFAHRGARRSRSSTVTAGRIGAGSRRALRSSNPPTSPAAGSTSRCRIRSG
jgi:hypothetical protein